MSITVELEPEVEAVLMEKANAAGLTVQEFARQILLKEGAPAPKYHPKVEAFRKKMEKYRGKLGPVLDEGCGREFYYGDHL